MPDKKTLKAALELFLENGYLDRGEADALIELILSDHKVTAEEKAFLQEAIQTCNFEEPALKVFKDFLANYERRTQVAP
jgi:hypothetical protein